MMNDIAFFSQDILLLLFLMVCTGALAGFCAGLLGIGGGLIIVPGLLLAFDLAGIESAYNMHVVVGTALGTIVLTGISSGLAHYRRHNFEISCIRRIGPGIAIGAVIGALTVKGMSTMELKILFAVAVGVLALLMQFDPSKFSLRQTLPPVPIPSIIGVGIGVVSSLMGIGGSVLNVPFMSLCGTPIHKAIGNSAMMGPMIALPGAIGFILVGLDVADLPPFSMGFFNWAAFLVIVPVSTFFAPFGAAMTQRLSVPHLRRVFSVFMIIIAIKMFYSAVFGA